MCYRIFLNCTHKQKIQSLFNVLALFINNERMYYMYIPFATNIIKNIYYFAEIPSNNVYGSLEFKDSNNSKKTIIYFDIYHKIQILS